MVVDPRKLATGCCMAIVTSRIPSDALLKRPINSRKYQGAVIIVWASAVFGSCSSTGVNLLKYGGR